MAGDREVVLELEEYPGMVGLGICMKKGLGCLDRLGTFIFLHDLRSGAHANCYCK